MLKINSMPKETLVELLHFLAENERFSSVSEKLEGSVSVDEVRTVLRELAREVSRIAITEQDKELADAKKSVHLSAKTKKIISYLSSQEERKLLTTFGLADK